VGIGLTYRVRDIMVASLYLPANLYILCMNHCREENTSHSQSMTIMNELGYLGSGAIKIF
jgi:hypothetical protein